MRVLTLILLTVLLSAFQPAPQMTLRDCIIASGYTANTGDVLRNTSGYRIYLESDLVGYDLVALLDAPGVDVGAQYKDVLMAARNKPDGITPANWARFWLDAEGAGKQPPLNDDPDIAALRMSRYTRQGESRPVLFVVADLDRNGTNEVYGFAYQHPYEPGAYTKVVGGYGWHGACMLRLR